MIDIDYLNKLVPLLKEHGVHSIKIEGLEITFHVEQKGTSVFGREDASSPALPDHHEDQPLSMAIAEAHRQQEEQMPVDLRTDNINSVDKIMYWSGDNSDEANEEALPLTGDKAL